MLENSEESEESSLIRAMIQEQRRLYDLRDVKGALKVVDAEGVTNIVSISNRPVDFGMMVRTADKQPRSYIDRTVDL